MVGIVATVERLFLLCPLLGGSTIGGSTVVGNGHHAQKHYLAAEMRSDSKIPKHFGTRVCLGK